jgi:rhamnopyranosyl-N-acetylglucosaminyl-diphospho-decaprenol beta-1,3/1,4-galactofuranosyltransferase
MNERVHAVVVTHNRRLLLARCLDALLDQVRPPDAIVVVDNASTDGTGELLRQHFPQVTVHRLAQNQGGAGGYAEGMQGAFSRGADWMWLLDDDVTADRDCLKELLEGSLISGKSVIVPRRVQLDGADCANDAIVVERAQRFDVINTDSLRERYHPLDLFTFEGPLIHRSIVERVGVPNRRLFICGDDIVYAIRINRARGSLASTLATRAIVRKQIPPPARTIVRSRMKGWITGNPLYEILPDGQHWKALYEFRNRHLIWRELGWRRRRLLHVVLHLGYIGGDLIYSMRHGWDWPLRLRWNATAWLLGVLGRDGAFLDPERYAARVAARRSTVR